MAFEQRATASPALFRWRPLLACLTAAALLALTVNPLDLTPEWIQSQSDARNGLREIQPSPETPAGALNLLKGAAEQMAHPESTTAATL